MFTVNKKGPVSLISTLQKNREHSEEGYDRGALFIFKLLGREGLRVHQVRGAKLLLVSISRTGNGWA
jgi:hypothetical protein